MKNFKYNINNLDCANCARKLEEELNKNKDFTNVSVNFNTCKLSYESNKDYSIEKLNKLIQKVEPCAYVTSLGEDIKVHKEFHLGILIIALVFGCIGHFINMPNILKNICYIISYSMLLYRTVYNAIKLLIKGNGINENALISISCIGALLLGKEMEGMMVITLYTIGKILEEKAINNSRRSVKELLDIKEEYASLKVKDKITKIKVEDVKVGDVLVVKQGERIPVDATVLSGETLLDVSSLTGESELVKVSDGDSVLSGCINTKDVIYIKASKVFSSSTVSKIISLLDDATDKKTKTETLVTKFSKIYTPVVLIGAILIIILLPLFFKVSISDSIYRGLTFLVISCPCAIAISIPLSYFTGIGASSRNGILIKGSNYLDNLSNANNIIFDKTGTLTNGSFKVSKIDITDNKYSMDDVIDILVKGESFSNHLLAKSILKLRDIKVDNSDIKDFKEVTGKGISFILNNKKIIIGNNKLCKCKNDAMLHLNIDGCHVASVFIDDGIKDNAKDVITSLKKLGIKTYMFTGDKKEVAEAIGNMLGIENIKYEMLPQEKYENFELISKDKSITVFVGDGVNDAPVLKRADIGISMGNVGSDLAIEASDIVLMSDDLNLLPLSINISKYTKKIIKQNLIFAMSIKVIVLLLSVFGLANMWMAVFADTGVTLLTILNTLRIMKKYKRN